MSVDLVNLLQTCDIWVVVKDLLGSEASKSINASCTCALNDGFNLPVDSQNRLPVFPT